MCVWYILLVHANSSESSVNWNVILLLRLTVNCLESFLFKCELKYVRVIMCMWTQVNILRSLVNRAALELEEVEGAHGDSPALEPDEIELGPEQVETGHGDSPALEHARDPEDEVSAALGGDSGDEAPAGMTQFGYAFKIFCILSILQQNSYKN